MLRKSQIFEDSLSHYIKFKQYEHCIKVIQPLAIYLFRNPYPDDAIFEPSLKMEPGPA